MPPRDKQGVTYVERVIVPKRHRQESLEHYLLRAGAAKGRCERTPSRIVVEPRTWQWLRSIGCHAPATLTATDRPRPMLSTFWSRREVAVPGACRKTPCCDYACHAA